MKIFKNYRNLLFLGEWHIHTNYTDGKNSVLEYSQKASELGIPLISFTEHVRRNMGYDFDKFLYDIKIVRNKYPDIIILTGIEAKVLPDGTLDCPLEIFNKVDYRLFAFHSFPADLSKYLFSLESIIKNIKVDGWAHPGLFFKKNKNIKIYNNELNHIFKLMAKKEILLEINFKYKLPYINWALKYLSLNTNNLVVFGGDIHSIEDLVLSWKIKNYFKKYCNNKILDKNLVEKYYILIGSPEIFVDNEGKSGVSV